MQESSNYRYDSTDNDNTRNGETGSDRLLAACYTELKSTRALLTDTQKENRDLKSKLNSKGDRKGFLWLNRRIVKWLYSE